MSFIADMRTVYQLALGRDRGATHAERLENFYGSQADHYDDFRENFLTGRRELIASCPWTKIERWVDLGAGTGGLIEFVPDDVLKRINIDLVDLSPSLLALAQQRIKFKDVSHARINQCDVTTYGAANSYDLVTMSYSLTMVPDWFLAVDNALRLLKPGGTIAIADFYVSRKYPVPGRRKHGWFTRIFWPTWFAFDNIQMTGEHLEYLNARFSMVSVYEGYTRVPYLLGAKAPVYRFVGVKR